MKIFDGHTDIFTDVIDQYLLGNKNTLLDIHLPKLEKGQITAGNFVFWDEPKHKDNSLKRLEISLEIVEKVLEDGVDHLIKIENKEDFTKAEELKLFAIILGIEGLRPIENNLDWIHKLQGDGVRTASLTWNEENLLATGLDGDVNRGLTQKGILALKMMEEAGIILDISHLNEKSFWDVIKHTSKPVIATHCNAYSLCNHKRNLKDDQIDAIKSTGGIIGVNACADFVDAKNPTVEKVIDHVDYIINRIGIEHVSFGFDFTDFLFHESKKDRSIIRRTTENLLDASHAVNAIEVMRKKGFSEKNIHAVAYQNLKAFYSINL